MIQHPHRQKGGAPQLGARREGEAGPYGIRTGEDDLDDHGPDDLDHDDGPDDGDDLDHDGPDDLDDEQQHDRDTEPKGR